MEKKLRLSKEKMIAGVCGGLGEYFEMDPTVVRLIVATLTIFTGFLGGLLFYLIAWVIMKQSTPIA
ncbi:MAG: PspC domain-containing protein [Paludibacteraceae bacterium]|nr:PspC domain-containing protein [Paludibacteraceae bacterium]HOH95840.1 PspC domain-containing protein [Candidatus Enterocola sp.]